MKFPSFLGESGKIGFAAPSFGCNTEPYYSAFQNALKKFREKGYDIHIGPNCYAGEGIGISNKPSLCAEEFMNMYLDSEPDCIISCGGGELMCEILPYMDFDALAEAEPKWFMGYSDNTNLTFLLAVLADTAAIYGPCAAAFGMEPWHPSIGDAWELLRGSKRRMRNYPLWEKESGKDEEHPCEPYHVTEDFRPRVCPEGEPVTMRGRLLGGCLDCLSKLAGTRFDRVKEFSEKYREDGILWFLESCDLNVMDMRRSLWMLREAGWFDRAAGFLIGRPMHYGESLLGLDQYEAVTGILGEMGVPIVMDLDIGHLPPMMPLVCGAMAEAETDGHTFQINMSFR